MRNGLVGGLVGAGLVGLLSYFVLLRPPGVAPDRMVDRVSQLESAATRLASAKPRQAYITLKKSDSARCLADIDVPHMGGYLMENVRWNVVDDDLNACRPDGPWAVWLVFEGPEFPFQQREIRIGRTGRTIPIKDTAAQKIHSYKVWMRGQNGADYELIDPDLEVEPPVRVIQ
jgi:hypothetical protein